MYWNETNVDLHNRVCLITFIADIHSGNNNHKRHKLIKTVAQIASEPCHYVIGLGDFWDCILFNDKRASHDDKCGTMDEEYEILKNILEPIKDRMLLLADGNHEIKIEKMRVGSPVKRLCKEWKIPYGGYSGFLKVNANRKQSNHRPPIVIYYHHGASSGRKTGGAVNRVEELAQYWGADIYAMAHNHKLWATVEPYVDWSGDKPLYFMNTGGFLETCTKNETGYGEIKQYNPLRLGTATIRWTMKGGGKTSIEISEYIKV